MVHQGDNIYVGNDNSAVNINGTAGQGFNVKNSVLSPLLFIIVLEALSRELRAGLPWELLYADGMVLIAESIKDLERKFEKGDLKEIVERKVEQEIVKEFEKGNLKSEIV